MITPSAYQLMTTKNNISNDLIKTVYTDFCLDDCLQSLESKDQAIKRIKDLTELLKMGEFRIRKWLSYSGALLESVAKEDCTKRVKDIDLATSQLPKEHTLREMWNSETDNLAFKFKHAMKRCLLSVIRSLYDPLEFLCPLALQAKKNLPECRYNKEWISSVDETKA